MPKRDSTQKRIDELERRIRELEARPLMLPIVIPAPYPVYPAPSVPPFLPYTPWCPCPTTVTCSQETIGGASGMLWCESPQNFC